MPFRGYGGLNVENRQFVTTPVTFNSLARGDAFEFRDDPGTEAVFSVFRCPTVKALFILTQYQSVTDGRTDGHPDRSNTSACIACYATALVKR